MGKYNPLKKTTEIFEKDKHLREIFRFNQFSENIEFCDHPIWDKSIEIGKAINDEDIIDIKYYLTSVHDVEPPKAIIGESCYIIAKRNSYHPVKRYIESIKWDGKNRLESWMYNTAQSEQNYYTCMAAAKFLIASINRIYNPGCKFDHMLILEGAQGIGKSTLIESLVTEEYYLDTNFDTKDRDLIDSFRGVWIVEISELSGMNKKDIEWMRSFISKKVDRIRLPYAARYKDFKRKCVFIGTHNPSGNNMYLRDDTGNRRYWPIECVGMVNIPWLKENRDQLWAEAYHRYKNKEQYHITARAALQILDSLHKDRELESPTHRIIKKWLEDNTIVVDEITMDEILEKVLKVNLERVRPKELLSMQTTVGIIMKRLGWRKGTNKDRHKYYKPVDYSLDEELESIFE